MRTWLWVYIVGANGHMCVFLGGMACFEFLILWSKMLMLCEYTLLVLMALYRLVFCGLSEKVMNIWWGCSCVICFYSSFYVCVRTLLTFCGRRTGRVLIRSSMIVSFCILQFCLWLCFHIFSSHQNKTAWGHRHLQRILT
jgi:hypothetical protein